MTAIDTLTRKLMDLGASTEMVVLVVEAVTSVTRDSHTASQMSRVTVTHVTPDDVRKAACLRKRKQREREKQQRLAVKEAEANDAAAPAVTVTNVTRDKRDMSQNHCDLLSSLSSSSETLNKQEPSEEGSKKKKADSSEKARARGQRMEAGAILTDVFRDAAIKLGAAPNDIPDYWAEFVDYWADVPGERGVKLRWLGTWRNRVRDQLKRGRTNGKARATGSSLSERAFALAEQARSAEREAGIDRPDDPLRKH